jgi:hypothetical protein
MIERQQGSGQSIVGFCAHEKLSPGSFHAWKRRLGWSERNIGLKMGRRSLLPVQIVGNAGGTAGSLEVQWPGGVVLRVQGCDAQTISAAVAAISASSTRKA